MARPVRLAIRGFVLVLCILAGLFFGLGGYTFYYAEGGSYLSDKPKACVNCHVMRDVYDGWEKSGHHAVATCNDCHVPHDFIGKWMSKAENGYHHSRAFTLQDFPEPIRIKPKNARILQANCRECHADLVHPIMAGKSDVDVSCTHCHASVGHGPTR